MKLYNNHLGNTRVTYEPIIDPIDSTVSYNLKGVFDYFPYCKLLRHYNSDAEKYNNTQHERDEETGFDYSGARFYDADVVRFLSVDHWAVNFPNISSFVYVGDNPLFYIDPDGQ